MRMHQHLPANPSICDLMEAAYNEGVEGHILMSAELENRIEFHYPNNGDAYTRISDAHANGWTDYRHNLEA